MSRRSLLDVGSLRVLDPVLGRVGVEQAPADCSGEDLAECLGRLETVSAWDRYPPRGDLGRSELGDRNIPERSRRLRQQPSELLDRLWLGVMLGEVRLYEFRIRSPTSGRPFASLTGLRTAEALEVQMLDELGQTAPSRALVGGCRSIRASLGSSQARAPFAPARGRGGGAGAPGSKLAASVGSRGLACSSGPAAAFVLASAATRHGSLRPILTATREPAYAARLARCISWAAALASRSRPGCPASRRTSRAPGVPRHGASVTGRPRRSRHRR
jgi:hypothetical protein